VQRTSSLIVTHDPLRSALACLDQIEFSDNYIIGLPSREPNPAFVELVAVGGSTAIPITGLRLTGNIFRSSGAHPTSGTLTAFKVNETDGKFGRSLLTNSLVAGNSYQGVKGSATRVQRSIWQNSPKATSWTFNLCDDMLFGNVSDGSNTTGSNSNSEVSMGREATYTNDIFAHLQYSVRVQDPATELGASAISGVDGCVVTVTTEKPVSGAVYLTADQSRDDNHCHGAHCHPQSGVQLL
jgi:hypothetical protein